MATVEHCLYCFETLAAHLEKRTPMTLYQVQASWASYPKGLEDEEEEAEHELPSSTSASDLEEEDLDPSSDLPGTKATTNPLSRPRIPAIQRLSNSNSNSNSRSSTPSSTSTTSLSPSTISSSSTSTSTSTSSFVPIGLHPRRTSQRNNSTITESPLFVTWNTVSPSSSHTKILRGCIGTFSTEPLSSGLSSYALTSSLSDHRFPPITLSELPTLEVSVTLLTDFETCSQPLDWEVGVHGIKISFYARNKRYGACYLPDVAVEQEWDREETVVSAMRKAGWGGKSEKWREVGDLKVVRFQGKAESVGWVEFKRWREWVEEGGRK